MVLSSPTLWGRTPDSHYPPWAPPDMAELKEHLLYSYLQHSMNMRTHPAVLGVGDRGPQLQTIALSLLHRAMHLSCMELAELMCHVSEYLCVCVPYIRVVLLLWRLAEVRQLT